MAICPFLWGIYSKDPQYILEITGSIKLYIYYVFFLYVILMIKFNL